MGIEFKYVAGRLEQQAVKIMIIKTMMKLNYMHEEPNKWKIEKKNKRINIQSYL